MEKEHLNSEQHTDDQKPRVDTGLACLVMIAKYHGTAAEPEQIKHTFAVGNDGMNETDIVRAARELGFKAKAASVEYERLQKLPVPFIAELTTGNGQEAIGNRRLEIP